MRRLVGVIVIVIALAIYAANQYRGGARSTDAGSPDQSVDWQPSAQPVANRSSRAGAPYQAEGVVVKVLADDNDGSRHQRFIVRLASGQTVLIAHNIDIAPRVQGLSVGDTVSFSGEYETNNKGGVVHWTHRDPSGRHAAGWIRHRGQTYQ
jgi:hypothetical protein